MEDFTSRTRLLLGDGVDALARSSVAVFGIGGVGSYVLEALVRAGVGRIIIVDADTVSVSNINRQLIATADTVGQKKTDAAAARARSINPNVDIVAYDIFYTPENADTVDLTGVSYVADAIDSITSKLELIRRAKAAGIPIISCMGTGNKLDPSRLEIADLYDTSVCPLAREMRRLCRRDGIDSLRVVYSREEPISVKSEPGVRTPPGSVSFVPSVAGLMMAGEIIRTLAK